MRGEVVREPNPPAYVVFADRALIAMAELRPTSRTELATLHGGARRSWRGSGLCF